MLLSRHAMMKSIAGALVLARSGYLFADSPIPILGYAGGHPQVDPAYISNGFISIRPGPIPILPAPTCVTGFVYVHPEFQVEALSPAPYPLVTDLNVNNTSLWEPDRTILTSQTIDMNNGEQRHISGKVIQTKNKGNSGAEPQQTSPTGMGLTGQICFRRNKPDNRPSQLIHATQE